MEWFVVTVLGGWGFWTWRQRNAYRLRAYLLEQKYIHGRAVDRAIAAQLARDGLDLAAIGGTPAVTDLLGRREAGATLERQARRLDAAHRGDRPTAPTHPLFAPFSRGSDRPPVPAGLEPISR